MVYLSVRARIIIWGVTLAVLLGRAGRIWGDEATSLPPVGVPAVGRLQTWGDELLFYGWRIQRDSATGRHRLLDGHDRLQASGTFDECRQTLEEVKRERRLPPMAGKAVLLLHGLAHDRTCLRDLGRYLQRRSDYIVFNFEYPGTHQSIGDDARALASVIANLEGIEEINFVAHSMGNIVVRHYLADQTDPQNGRRPDPRFRRMVMLGPPNHGSALASSLADNGAFKAFLGKPALELGRHWAWEAVNLATPQFEFGILAGGLGNKFGFNPFLAGDDDGIVTVDSARLAGASDFLLLPVTHLPMVFDTRVFRCVLSFLQNGYFVAPDRRRPIEKG